MCWKRWRIFLVEKLEWKNFGWSWLETWRQLRPMLSRYIYTGSSSHLRLCSPRPTSPWPGETRGQARPPRRGWTGTACLHSVTRVTGDTCHDRSTTFEAASEGRDEVPFMFSSSGILWIICKEKFQSSPWDRDYMGMLYKYRELRIFSSIVCDWWCGRNMKVLVLKILKIWDDLR